MTLSTKLFQKASELIPGGVNSPVRSFKNVEQIPIFIEKAKGPRIWDVDGKDYIDYIGTWGPAILGHAPNVILNAVHEKAKKGLSFGLCHSVEIEMAKFICDSVNSVQKVRMVNSGTEATMTAIRLSRGFTNRKYILKFEGCYHGHVDSLLISAGSGATTHGVPDSLGIPDDFSKLTFVLPFNDINAVEKLFKEHKDQIAGVILEPVMGNAGLILPKNNFLKELEKICKKNQTLLIFDEVMTGFRLHKGGVQQIYQIDPDLSTFGKVIGGGLPVGAIGGKAEIMDFLSPTGGVYQAGTLSGNPLSLIAGLTQLNELKNNNSWQYLEDIGQYFEIEINKILNKSEIPCSFVRIGSMFCFYFCKCDVNNFKDLKNSDSEIFQKFFNHMLDNGILLAPSAYEVGFLSTTHGFDEINLTLKVISEFFFK